jgi:formylglycine-generating enzyme required for sulfatase activity
MNARRQSFIRLSRKANMLHVLLAIFLCPLGKSTRAGEENTGDHARDTILLLSGEKLPCAIVNTSFVFRTVYARLEFPAAAIAKIDLTVQNGALHTLTTTAGDRLTGLLEDPVFWISSAETAKPHIPRETVASVYFREPKRLPNETSLQLRLHSGDSLIGQLSRDLQLLTVGSPRPAVISSAELRSFSRLQGNRDDVKAVLMDGRIVEGQPAFDTVEVQLNAGPALELNRIFLESISRIGRVESAARPIPVERPGMVWIAPGEFTMGTPPEEIGRDPDEGPLTRVELLHGFWIDRHEVTQAEYQAVMQTNPSSTVGTNLPVDKVSWFDAMNYCRRLNVLEENAGRLPDGFGYRLPTEAEWEFACRAGTTTRFSHGDDPNDSELNDFAWYTRNSESAAHPVGTRRANAWGIYDMHGNVWEWCLDRWEGALPGGTITNQPAASKGNLRVARGGSWLYEAKACRSANRDDYSPWNRCSDLGFRVVLASLENTGEKQ